MSNIILAPIVEKFISEITKKYAPNFKIKDKSKPDGIMKIISKIVKIFNKNFDKSYITTILETAWVPSDFTKLNPNSQLDIIIHETVHEYDLNRLGKFLYVVLYLSPQIFSIFSLLSILSIWFSLSWLWCLLFLIFVSPLPSPGRMLIELRGYRSNVLFHKNVIKRSKMNLKEKIDWITNQFTGSYYYYMFPCKKYIETKLLDTDLYENKQIYSEIINWLKANEVIKSK